MPRTYNTQNKLHVKKGDIVKVISGDDKGKTGRVLMVFPAKQRVLVEGINLHTKHQKPNQENPQGGRTQKELPIHVSNVQPLDPASGEATRIGRKRADGDGPWVRYAKKSGEVLDK